MNKGKSIKKYRKGLSSAEARVLSDLSFNGKQIFTLEDIKKYDKNSKDFLYNLTQKNWVIRIKKGLYMIAPLVAGELGAQSYTVHSFIIASHLVEPYYISHWSALNYYGYTNQTPPAVYITTTKPRNKKHILDTEFIFVTLVARKMFGTTEIKIEDKSVNISTPEKTITDCLDHPEHCGGIEEVAKTLYFEHQDFDIEKIIRNAKKMGNKTIIKRLGYLFDTYKFHEYEKLLEGITLSEGYANLDPKLPKKGRINYKWKLRLNTKITPDHWIK
jgi:predicted transcriptional regulator of viral defense system